MFVYHIFPPEYAEGGLRGSRSKYVILSVLQYLSLPHLFLPDSRSPVGFLLDSCWIPTKFPKRPFHIFFHFPQLDSYWTPTGFLLDSYWTPTELQLNLNKCHKLNAVVILDSYWIPTGFLLEFHYC